MTTTADQIKEVEIRGAIRIEARDLAYDGTKPEQVVSILRDRHNNLPKSICADDLWAYIYDESYVFHLNWLNSDNENWVH